MKKSIKTYYKNLLKNKLNRIIYYKNQPKKKKKRKNKSLLSKTVRVIAVIINILKGEQLRKMNLLLGGAYVLCKGGVIIWKMHIFVSLYSYLMEIRDIFLLCMMGMEDKKLLILPLNTLRKFLKINKKILKQKIIEKHLNKAFCSLMNR